MKRTQTLELLVPKYVTRFSCIGGDCEDTCCSGWRVDLDKDSVIAYENCVDPVARPLLKKYVKRSSNAHSAAQFGYMDVVSESCRDCGMLTQNKRCVIQERLGEEALSNTCATYPRLINQVHGLHQMVLTLSCPEAARLALMAPDAFEFAAMEKQVRSANIGIPKWPAGVSDSIADEVRIFLFQLLQTRELELTPRLQLVGLFCERLTSLLHEERPEDIHDLVQAFDQELTEGALFKDVEHPQPRPDVQARLAALLLHAKSMAYHSPHQRRVMDQVLAGLPGNTKEGVDPAFLERGHIRLQEALEAAPWLLDHFVLNQVLSESFPWGCRSPLEHLGNLAVRLVILNVMLVGRAAARAESMTPGELAETAGVFARHYEHNAPFRAKVDQVLVEGGWNTLSRIALLFPYQAQCRSRSVEDSRAASLSQGGNTGSVALAAITQAPSMAERLADTRPARQPKKGCFPDGHFYSPVVDTEDVAARIEQIYPRTPEIPGIDFRDDMQKYLILHALARFLPEYDYSEHGEPDNDLERFYTQNSQFSWLDSRALFALLRYWLPRRIIEVGSGYSSLLMSDVNRRFLGGRTRITCIEPFPRPFLHNPELGVDLEACRVQQVPLELFDELETGDMLFIDSSHVVKTGSDVNYLFLQVLPRLKPGVIVHIHDIFLPFDYPRDWVLVENRSWNEQYMLQALLQHSKGYRVLFGCQYAYHRFPQEVIAAIGHPRGIGFGGGSFYLERI